MNELPEESPMTVAEVAKYLRIDRESVYRLCLSGKLVAYKVGGWRIWKKDVLAYLEAKRHKPANIPPHRPAPSAASQAATLETLRRFGVRV